MNNYKNCTTIDIERNKLLDKAIDWCRQKLKQEKSSRYNFTGKRLEGYESAMLSVMSYLHSEKVKVEE